MFRALVVLYLGLQSQTFLSSTLRILSQLSLLVWLLVLWSSALHYPVYAFGSAVVAGLGPGPPVPGSLLGLCNLIYALKSAIIAGLGPGLPVPGSLDLWNSVYAIG